MRARGIAGSTPDVSIVIPCYNEERILEESVREIRKTMEQSVYSYEMILIDDRSTDGTREIIKRICEGAPDARYIFHEKNVGRGGTVREGLLAARGGIAGFLDIDLEVHSRYIPSMVQAVADGADVVCGYRVYNMAFQFDDIFRTALSVCYRFLVGVLLKPDVRDSEAGYKFFNMAAAGPVIRLTRNEHWFWDTEIMALAAIRGLSCAEVPMVCIRRADKKTTVRPIRDSLLYLIALSGFRRRYRKSITYRSPRLYQAAMRPLYRGCYDARYEAIVEEVPEGAEVLDVCCGDALLYEKWLKKKNARYIGLDINPAFIAAAARGGIDARFFDVERGTDLPRAEYVVMQGSLYQFIPGAEAMVARLVSAARRRVIITEAVRNIGESGNPALKRFAEKMTNPGTGPKTERFDRESLGILMAKFKVLKKEEICGGREMLYVIEGAAEKARPE